MSDDNIFMRAAFSGKIELPQSYPSCTQSSTNKKTRKPQKKHSYSKLEDLMLLKGVEKKGRDWRAVLSYMKDHCDLLDDECAEFYLNCESQGGNKAMQDRIRKRVSALEKGKNEVKSSQKTTKSTKTFIEEEFQNGTSSSEEDAISQEMSEITSSIKRRDAKYVMDSQDLDGEEPSDIAETLKRRCKDEKQKSSTNSTANKKNKSKKQKIDQLLDQLPTFMESANKAAQAHTEALKKWEKKYALVSSESD